MKHETPLLYHFKTRHFWFDLLVLASLFALAAYYPLLKIIPLVASLELVSFFSFHFLAKKSRVQVQGFVGGLVSSTVVYLQILNDRKFSSLDSHELKMTLLFAMCAMLCECIFILWFIAGDIGFAFYLPFLSQLLFFCVVIAFYAFLLPDDDLKREDISDIDIMIDHPIVWMSVAKFSLLVFVLVFVLRFIGTELDLSENLSILLVSLFEAHAILASLLTQQSVHGFDNDFLKLIFIILLGNTVSKSFLVLRGKNLDKPWSLILWIFSAYLLSLFGTFLWVSYLSA